MQLILRPPLKPRLGGGAAGRHRTRLGHPGAHTPDKACALHCREERLVRCTARGAGRGCRAVREGQHRCVVAGKELTRLSVSFKFPDWLRGPATFPLPC